MRLATRILYSVASESHNGLGRGGAWNSSGTIVFGAILIFEGLSRVSADGGPVESATPVDIDRGENSHGWPVFLPDGVHFLFYVRASVDERRGVRGSTPDSRSVVRWATRLLHRPDRSARGRARSTS